MTKKIYILETTGQENNRYHYLTYELAQTVKERMIEDILVKYPYYIIEEHNDYYTNFIDLDKDFVYSIEIIEGDLHSSL